MVTITSEHTGVEIQTRVWIESGIITGVGLHLLLCKLKECACTAINSESIFSVFCQRFEGFECWMMGCFSPFFSCVDRVWSVKTTPPTRLLNLESTLILGSFACRGGCEVILYVFVCTNFNGIQIVTCM